MRNAMVGNYNVDKYDNLISSNQQMQRGDAITTYDHSQLVDYSYRTFLKK